MEHAANLPEVLEEQSVGGVVSIEILGSLWPSEKISGDERQPGQRMRGMLLTGDQARQIETALRYLGLAVKIRFASRRLAARPGADGDRVNRNKQRRASEVPAEPMDLSQGGLGDRLLNSTTIASGAWLAVPFGILHQNPDPGVLAPGNPAYGALQLLFREAREHRRTGPGWAHYPVWSRPTQEFVRGLKRHRNPQETAKFFLLTLCAQGWVFRPKSG